MNLSITSLSRRVHIKGINQHLKFLEDSARNPSPSPTLSQDGTTHHRYRAERQNAGKSNPEDEEKKHVPLVKPRRLKLVVIQLLSQFEAHPCSTIGIQQFALGLLVYFIEKKRLV